MKNNKGYTTIELLAFTIILVVISSLIAGVLYSTLRGSGKAKIGGIVAQNGNYALSVITDIITSSEAITAINGDQDVNTCVPTSGPISSIKLKRIDGGETTISCSSSDGSIASSSGSVSVSLIDNTQVEVADCSSFIVCDQENPYSYPIINVSFKLQDKNNKPEIVESSFSSDFKTSVSMRNYSP